MMQEVKSLSLVECQDIILRMTAKHASAWREARLVLDKIEERRHIGPA